MNEPIRVFESMISGIINSPSNTPTEIISLRANYKTDVLQWLTYELDKSLFLQRAIQIGKIELVQEFLELGADIDFISNDCSPLQIALINNKTKIAMLLLTYGCNLHTRTDNSTELFLVAQHLESTDTNTASIIQKLLQMGVDYNHESNGKIALDLVDTELNPDLTTIFQENQSVTRLPESGYDQIIPTSSEAANQAGFKLMTYYIARINSTFPTKTKTIIDWTVDKEPKTGVKHKGLWVETEGIQSMTAANIAKFRDNHILQKIHQIPAETCIFDATASCGADTFSFLYNFQGMVISNELNLNTFKCLKHNVSLFKSMLDYKLHRFRLGNACDVLEPSSTLERDLFEKIQLMYIDLPWGGSSSSFSDEQQTYRHETAIMLKITNNKNETTNIDNFVMQCFAAQSQLLYVVLKLPLNFDRNIVVKLINAKFMVNCYRIFDEKGGGSQKILRLTMDNFQEKMIFAVITRSSVVQSLTYEKCLFCSSKRSNMPAEGPLLCRSALQEGKFVENTNVPNYPLYHKEYQKRFTTDFWMSISDKIDDLIQFLYL